MKSRNTTSPPAVAALEPGTDDGGADERADGGADERADGGADERADGGADARAEAGVDGELETRRFATRTTFGGQR